MYASATVHRKKRFTNQRYAAARDAVFPHLTCTAAKREIADRIIKEITSRLTFLNNVGLDYLSLERSADTLSGGEAQRIRLASQIGSA
jgi:excinuclease ABC subunit A